MHRSIASPRRPRVWRLFLLVCGLACLGVLPLPAQADDADNANNDPQARMQHAKKLADQGEYEAALEEYLWCYDDGGNGHPEFTGVRGSFLLTQISQLGKVYPPALDALRERRNDVEERIDREGVGTQMGMLAMQLAILNHTLGDDDRNVQLYRNLKANYPNHPMLSYLRRTSADALEAAGELEPIVDLLASTADAAADDADWKRPMLPANMPATCRPAYWIDQAAYADRLASSDSEIRNAALESRWELVQRAVAHANVTGDMVFHRTVAVGYFGTFTRALNSWAVRTNSDFAASVNAKRRECVYIHGDCTGEVAVQDGMVHILGDLNGKVVVTGQAEVVVAGNLGADAVITCEGITAIFVGGDAIGNIAAAGSSDIWINGSLYGTVATGNPSTDLYIIGDFLGRVRPTRDASLLHIDVGGYMSTDSFMSICRHDYTEFSASAGVSDRTPGLQTDGPGMVGRSCWVAHAQAGD